MSALIQPVALLLIILAGYLFKRAGLFEDRDYRIMQTIIFNLQSGADLYIASVSDVLRNYRYDEPCYGTLLFKNRTYKSGGPYGRGAA